MKLTITTLIAALIASMAWVATAQDSEKKGSEARAEREGQRRGGGPGGRGDMLSRLPVYKALDKDGDGALSEEEIKNASAALLALDKDKDGKLSKEEISPAWGGRNRGGGDRAGGRQRGGGEEGGRPERPKRPAAE